MQSSMIVIRAATPEDRLPFFRMFEIYQREFSDVWEQDLDVYGECCHSLERLWRNEHCYPFLACVDGRYAGFALVDAVVKAEESTCWMDRFFILKKYRHLGVGRELATQVFTALPGKWEVAQMTDSVEAQTFWRTVISGYTQGNYSENAMTDGWWQGIVHGFESRSSADALTVSRPIPVGLIVSGELSAHGILGADGAGCVH
jgi:predicted acetyltransferase